MAKTKDINTKKNFNMRKNIIGALVLLIALIVIFYNLKISNYRFILLGIFFLIFSVFIFCNGVETRKFGFVILFYLILELLLFSPPLIREDGKISSLADISRLSELTDTLMVLSLLGILIYYLFFKQNKKLDVRGKK